MKYRAVDVNTRDFVLFAEDPTTGSQVSCTRFAVDNVAVLAGICGEAEADFSIEASYSLDAEDVARLASAFSVSVPEGKFDFSVSSWKPLRRPLPPYHIHTGYELQLMLEGRKPFAKFSGALKDDWMDDLLAKFDPFVRAGRLVRRETETPFEDCPGDGVREVTFCLPGQEWRNDSHALLWKVAAKSKWNEALERFEGALLGYEEWQCDWWIAHLRRCSAGFGMATAFVAVTKSELAWVRASGLRALSWMNDEPDLKLILYGEAPRPERHIAVMEAENRSAVLRLGINHDFLRDRTRSGQPSELVYKVGRAESPALNGKLKAPIEIVAPIAELT